MKALIITQCKYEEVPDNYMVHRFYYEATDGRVFNADHVDSITVGPYKNIKLMEFKPIKICDNKGNVEMFCVVPDSVESIKLAEIVTGVINYGNGAYEMYKSVNNRHTKFIEQVNILKGSFWKRLVFLFKGDFK